MDRNSIFLTAFICIIVSSVGGQSPSSSPTATPAPPTTTTPPPQAASPPQVAATPPPVASTPPPLASPPPATPPPVASPPPATPPPVASPPPATPPPVASPPPATPPVASPPPAPVAAPPAAVPVSSPAVTPTAAPSPLTLSPPAPPTGAPSPSLTTDLSPAPSATDVSHLRHNFHTIFSRSKDLSHCSNRSSVSELLAGRLPNAERGFVHRVSLLTFGLGSEIWDFSGVEKMGSMVGSMYLKQSQEEQAKHQMKKILLLGILLSLLLVTLIFQPSFANQQQASTNTVFFIRWDDNEREKCIARTSVRKGVRKQRYLTSYCEICCKECKCVPLNNYGNKHECPCYKEKKNIKGKPKCP
ncbi:LOW QUALITY PROTEIN: hypothetical protein OSB04_015945 [Centaurea solstitialis]|uniref:Uncharacterized protein n=1 Tax=Centaurea solstitialis TaxID=347529 RepID=A0AA38WGZ7_9ASTR|nr:LOW QUALITY PROTEIN: hypothetical protein OSB04_015945 [Centaurea solstitialis]